MDFLSDDVGKIYRKYLVPTLGSALAMSIYSFVDTIAVGQYAGADGSAAIAVINPVYCIMTVIDFLCSTGGSVRFGNAVGEGNEEKGNAYFTVSVFLCALLSVSAWILFSLHLESFLRFFGADDEVLPYAMEYGRWIVRFFPVIVAPDFMAPFIRMDKNPKLAMGAVMIGGGLNMFLDWLLVFPLGMGMAGAALATVIGTIVQCCIMLSHFFSKRSSLYFVKPTHVIPAVKKVLATGGASSMLDLGNVFLSILMNRQVLAYGGAEALGIYGVVNTITVLVQALYAGVGQTIQPGVSVNHGAQKKDRVRAFYYLGVKTVILMGCALTLLGELFPRQIIRIFIHATDEVLAMAPQIMRLYFICFPFMGYCVLSAYFLQSVLKQKASTVIALMRSLILPGIFLFVLPAVLDAAGVYLSVPLSDALTALATYLYISRRMKLTLKQ